MQALKQKDAILVYTAIILHEIKIHLFYKILSNKFK